MGRLEQAARSAGHLIGWVPDVSVGIRGLFPTRSAWKPSGVPFCCGGLVWLTAGGPRKYGAPGGPPPPRGGGGKRPVIRALALVLIGFDLAAVRAHAGADRSLACANYGRSLGRVVP